MSLNLVYLSLGSNQGDPKQNLVAAAAQIAGLPGTKLLAKSSLYRTAPVGYTDQDQFLNAVLKIDTRMGPLELLDRTQAIENELGRQRTIRWGPRTIDIDILLFNQEEIHMPRLQVPHPEMARRLFVLVPLAEIDADLTIPRLGPLREVLAGLGGEQSGEQEIFLVEKEHQW